MTIDIRPAVPADIPAVLSLWSEAAAPTTTDDADALGALLARDPDALLVAASSNEAIVGSVIAAWDGWRGSVYRLAVAPAFRRDGLGRRLLEEAEHRFRRVGARRTHAIVMGTDERAMGFWLASDWEQQHSQHRFTHGYSRPEPVPPPPR